MKFKSAIYLSLSVMVFVSSFLFPAVIFKLSPDAFPASSPTEVWWGYEMFFYGFFGILLSQAGAVSWVSNVFYAMTFYCLIKDKYKYARIVSMLAVAMGLAFPIFAFLFPLPQDEGGVIHARFFRPGIGYFLWMLALVVVALVSHSEFKKEKDNQMTFEVCEL